MTFHCFFEQSGTFKNEFKKLGYEAYDYDILDDFGETDFKMDLFKEIETAYEGGESVFDSIKEEDQIIAFFPCTRFEDQIVMGFKGGLNQCKNWSDEKKMEYCIKLHNELNQLYVALNQLCIVCIRKNIPLIVENPRGSYHYLNRYWCLKPTIIDKDRTERGDFYRKPTQYWFINRKPSNNFIFGEYAETKEVKIIRYIKGKDRKRQRSMIHPDYANRFIREFII